MKILPLAAIGVILHLSSAHAEFDLAKEEQKAYLEARATSLCSESEHLIFTCKIHRKTASICASESADKSDSYIQYRYGAIGNVEIKIPTPANQNSSFVASMKEFGASWGAFYIRFTSGQHKYYVYSASVRGPNDPETGASTRIEPSGVAVFLENKKVFSKECSPPWYDRNFNDYFLRGRIREMRDTEDIAPIEIAFPSKP